MDFFLRLAIDEKYTTVAIGVDATRVDLGEFGADELESLAIKLERTAEDMRDFVSYMRTTKQIAEATEY